jgi:hypothetical protein
LQRGKTRAVFLGENIALHMRKKRDVLHKARRQKQGFALIKNINDMYFSSTF